MSRGSCRLAALVLALALLTGPGCKKPYRVGEFVLVEWDEDEAPYPAYVIAQTATRYRVHFDGYDSRWDEDVSVDRIKGRVEGPIGTPPPPPKKVARAAGLASPRASGSAGEAAASPYREGDRVRVSWRGAVYSAIVLKVEAKDRLLLHYEGHESAWDEVVQTDRIVGRK